MQQVKIKIINSFPYCHHHRSGNVRIPSDFIFEATKHFGDPTHGEEPVYYCADMNQCRDVNGLVGIKTFIPSAVEEIR